MGGGRVAHCKVPNVRLYSKGGPQLECSEAHHRFSQTGSRAKLRNRNALAGTKTMKMKV